MEGQGIECCGPEGWQDEKPVGEQGLKVGAERIPPSQGFQIAHLDLVELQLAIQQPPASCDFYVKQNGIKFAVQFLGPMSHISSAQ